MGSPIAHGAEQVLRRARRRTKPPPPASSGTAWLYFAITTTCLSWLTAGAIGGPWIDGSDPLARRLFWAALYYAVVMGWPPLVGAWFARLVRDERKRTPSGLRRPRVRELAVAVVLAVGLAVLSMLIARLFGEPSGRLGSDLVNREVAIAGALVVLIVQAFTEELGWRGFPLTCAIDRWGERVGLIVHGLAWGIWYAPLFLVSGGTPSNSLPIAAGFALTCLLLGVVFGWLRLWSGSIFPSMVANAVLTAVAGLPMLALIGTDGGHAAVFGWPGWIAIGGVALVLLIWRRRDLTGRPP